MTEKFDPISSPAHYCFGTIQPIEVIEDWGLNFRLANVIKYVGRSGKKGTPLEDLQKAMWYLEREINTLKTQQEKQEKQQQADHLPGITYLPPQEESPEEI